MNFLWRSILSACSSWHEECSSNNPAWCFPPRVLVKVRSNSKITNECSSKKKNFPSKSFSVHFEGCFAQPDENFSQRSHLSIHSKSDKQNLTFFPSFLIPQFGRSDEKNKVLTNKSKNCPSYEIFLLKKRTKKKKILVFLWANTESDPPDL